MTYLGELNTAIVIVAVIYWALNKDLGTYLFMGWGANRIVNGFLKVTACVYRPWIRSDLIVCPLIKNGLSGPVGTLLSCFLQVFYVVFLFPWCLKRLEKAE